MPISLIEYLDNRQASHRYGSKGLHDMAISIEVFTLLLNICMGAFCVALVRVFRDSIFADIAKFLFILAVSLMAHSAIDVFITGPDTFFIYGISALVASICYLLLVYAVFAALQNMIKSEGK